MSLEEAAREAAERLRTASHGKCRCKGCERMIAKNASAILGVLYERERENRNE